ncbi:hypothetical protein [Cryobacterium sp. BB307]|uniref:hypothetical protein n=1 Tax=Cryobacterium sp. BB307 TaxID=2716317 RepID=UPI0014461942|nr:hypothetical protein [Cryobacterium sp. BB307]
MSYETLARAAVLRMDPVAQRTWPNSYTSLAETYSDLFASSGWQAEEFRRRLWEKYFSVADWDQEAAVDRIC